MPALVRNTAIALLGLLLPAMASAAAPTSSSPDVLAPVMAGEFALQAGQLKEAARWYLQAARTEVDAGLAERATRIALLANDDTRAAEALSLWRQRAPESLAMRSADASLALRKGDAVAARMQLVALMRDPTPAGWRHALTVLGRGGRDPELSARLLGELVDADAIPDQLQAWLAFGGLAQGLGKAPLAERIVAGAVQRFPGEPRIALLHASQLNRAGKADQAREILDGLMSGVADAPELRLALAREYDALGDPAAAAAALAQGNQDSFTYGLRASLLAQAEDNATLLLLYEELRKDATDPDPEQRMLLGQMAEFLERQAEALQWYRSVPGGRLRNQARLRIASVMFEMGQKVQAFEEAARLQADAAIDEDARRDAYLLEAELRQKDQDDAGELEALGRGLGAYPDDSALLYARGLAWERRDRIDRAEADLRRILVTDPENVAALNALGYTLADRTTRYQEALELIGRARAADPGQAAIIDSYGWVLYRLGRVDEALMELRRAYNLMKDPEVAAHLAEVLWFSGQKDEARRLFDEGIKLDPENRSLQRALEKTGA